MPKPALPTDLDDFSKLLDAAIDAAPRSSSGSVNIPAVARGILACYSIPPALQQRAQEFWLAALLVERLEEDAEIDDEE